jgi:hypothetical protein
VELWEVIAEAVRRSSGEAFEDKKDELQSILNEAADHVNTQNGSIIGMLKDFAIAIALFLGVDGLPALGALEGVQLVEDAAGPTGRGFAWGYLLGYGAFSLGQPLFRVAQHAIEDAFTTQIHDPQTAADLAIRGLIERGHAHDEGAGSGLDVHHMEQLIALARTRFTMSELLELLRRETITHTEYHDAMIRNGYDPADILRSVKLERNLLSAADLALANLRGEMTEETMLAYAKELGVTPDDVKVLVNNTGEPPGLMQLLEAYRREFIDEKRLVHGIRQSRVRNEWIDVVEKLRFTPMSTADAANAVVRNYLSNEDGKKIAEQNGLEPQHWDLVHLINGRPLAHMEMGSLYYRGQATREQFDQAMRESDLKDKYIRQSFEITRPLIPDRLLVEAIQEGVVSLEVGTRKLLEHGFSEEDASILLHLGLMKRTGTSKGLTKADILAAFAEGIMSEGDALRHLENLGYSKVDAQTEIHLQQAKAQASALREEVTHVRDAYLSGRVTVTVAEADLQGLGVARAQAQHLIGVWNKEARHATKLLTAAQVRKATNDKILTAGEGVDRLVALGYTVADARILINE